METIGFIGLGNMGAPMAYNLLEAGYRLIVHDVRVDALTPFVKRGAISNSSPAEVATNSDFVFSSLPGPLEVESVSLGHTGVLSGIHHGSIYVDLSTIGPTLARNIEPHFRKKGTSFLDAPVSGGTTGAATGNLAIMVGGDLAAYERVVPILRAIGDKVFRAGDVGAGSVSKIVHNMINRIIQQALAEGLTLGVKAGVEPEALWECVRRGTVGRASALHEGIPRKVFRNEFTPPGFALSLAKKDLGLALDLAQEFSVPLPLGNLTAQITTEGVNRGWGDMDFNVTFLLQEEAAKVQVRAPNVDPDYASKFISTHPEIGKAP